MASVSCLASRTILRCAAFSFVERRFLGSEGTGASIGKKPFDRSDCEVLGSRSGGESVRGFCDTVRDVVARVDGRLVACFPFISGLAMDGGVLRQIRHQPRA